jgi:hemoglobin-like flavoprotein
MTTLTLEITSYYQGNILMSDVTQENPSDLDVLLLISTFTKVAPEADELAGTFYHILFEKYPNLKPLFAKVDMAKQRKKLIESLQLVIANVHSTEVIERLLQNLGKKHVGYGAVLTDYPLIGDALLQALKYHLGKDWTPEAEKTWTAAYQMIAGLMTEGARSVDTDNAPAVASTAATVASSATQPSIDQFDFNKFFIASAIAGVTVICGYTAWTMYQGSSQTTPTEQKQ